MKVAIVYDGGSSEWSETDVAAVMANVHQVQTGLRAGGHRTDPDSRSTCTTCGGCPRIQRHDLVFNLLEGINGVACYEDWSVGAIELTGVPFTGCRFSAITLCHRKHVANTLLDRAGVPVPAFALARKNELPAGLKLPVIVKPAARGRLGGHRRRLGLRYQEGGEGTAGPGERAVGRGHGPGIRGRP